MHVTRLKISNIRAISDFELVFAPEAAAGWHVVLGDNGAGKSSVIRALALAFAGGPNVSATRQDWQNWLRTGTNHGSVEVDVVRTGQLDEFIGKGRQTSSIHLQADFTRETIKDQSHVQIGFAKTKGGAERTVWSLAGGWFSASFGPFRRFSGGDSAWERLFVAPDFRRAAAHFSAFGEDVALTEPLPWLRQLHVQSLEDPTGLAAQTRDSMRNFFNRSGLLPHGAEITEINSQRILIRDGEGNEVPVEQMSDGYRSVLSLTFELMRQMILIYGPQVALKHIDPELAVVNLPGVVAIDEVDAHLHPAWQARIGEWFTVHFPQVQFIVTTHSPIVCRAARNGTIWRLAAPGMEDYSGEITGIDRDRLVSGDILEAMGTELFGTEAAASKETTASLERIAQLNKNRALGKISKAEAAELAQLQGAMPTASSTIAA